MAKFPCGVCCIDVKYKGVSCNLCKNWFHAECVNMKNEMFKKLQKTQPHTWTCKMCTELNRHNNTETLDSEDSSLTEINNISSSVEKLYHNKKSVKTPEASFISVLTTSTPSEQTSQTNTSFSSTPKQFTKPRALDSKELSLNSSFHDIEKSILKNDFQDNEEMAAKAGLAVLKENNFLKNKNAELTLKISCMEAIIEENEKDIEKYSLKMEVSQQNIAELELQLTHEKQNHTDIQKIFEEHDKKQTETLISLEDKIKKQENLIASLQEKLQKQKESNQSNNFKNCQTQTNSSDVKDKVESASFLILEVGQLRKTQSEMEAKFQSLEAAVKNQEEKYVEIRKTFEDRRKKDKNKDIVQTKTKMSEGPKGNKKHNIENKPNTRETYNKFSVSLQVKKGKELNSSSETLSNIKYATKHVSKTKEELSSKLSPVRNEDKASLDNKNTAQTTRENPISTEKLNTILPKQRKTRSTNSPPSSAQIRLPGETLEEFFKKHIEKAVQANKDATLIPTNIKTNVTRKGTCKPTPIPHQIQVQAEVHLPDHFLGHTRTQITNP